MCVYIYGERERERERVYNGFTVVAGDARQIVLAVGKVLSLLALLVQKYKYQRARTCCTSTKVRILAVLVRKYKY